MGNQCETLIPSRLEDITFLSHQTNDTELKSAIVFNASIHDNTINHL